MRRLRRFLLAVTSTALSFGVVLAVLAFALLGTDAGQALVRQQTEFAVARLLGGDFTAVLGDQSIDLAEDGGLAIRWSRVSLLRGNSPRPVSEIATIKVGFAVLPLLAGRLEFRTIEIAGAEIDLTRDPVPGAGPSKDLPVPGTPSPTLSERSRRIMAGLESQVAGLTRIGIVRATLSEVTVIAPIGAGGAPFVADIDRATFALTDGRALALSATLRIDRTPVPVAGSAVYDPAAGRLTAMVVAVGPVGLGSLIPPASPAAKLDARPFATDAPGSLTLAVTDREADGKRVATLSLDLGQGALQAGRGHTRIEKAHVSLVHVEGEEAIELAGTEFVFDGFSTALDGRAVAIYDGPRDNGFNGFDFALQSRDMRSTVAGPEPHGASFLAEGRSDSAASEVRISKVTLATGSGSLGGSGVLRYGAPDSMSSLRLVASDLQAASVKAFWPFNIAVNTRRWVRDHVADVGGVTGGLVALDVRQDRMDAAFRPGNHPDPDELDLSLALEGASFKTTGALPGMRKANAEVRTLGGDTVISLESATIEGFEDVVVAPSSIAFLAAPEGSRQEIDGTLSLLLEGEMDQLLAIAAREPINALRTLDLTPEDVTGKASVAAALAFVLGDDVPREEQFGAWSVAAELEEVDLKIPVEGRVLAGLSGPVTIAPGAASGEVEGTVDGIPAVLDFNRPFGTSPIGEKRLTVDLSLDAEGVAKHAPALAEIVDGPVGARVVQQSDGPLKGTVDLKDAALTLPGIGWRKGRGVPAALVFDIVPGEAGTTLENLALTGDGFAAEGEVATDKDGLRLASLASVALNPGDDVDVTVERVANGYSIRVEGRRLDARPFLADLKAGLGAKGGGPGARSKRQIDVGIAVDRLTGFGGKELADFSLNYAGSGGEIAALSLSGQSGGGRFSADVSPRGKQRAIQLRARDAGTLADFTGFYSRMEGGAVSLDLLGTASSGYRGTLVAKDFTLVDEPRLSNLVGSSPSPNAATLAQAVGTELRTERAFFDHASVGISYGKGGLRVSSGIIRGPVFGSSFSGTVYDSKNRIDIVGSFMPAYGVNRIFGAIPLVGQILGNGNEGGLIGITYRLSGAFAAPKLTVNPISAIAPGIFRSIFAYQ